MSRELTRIRRAQTEMLSSMSQKKTRQMLFYETMKPPVEIGGEPKRASISWRGSDDYLAVRDSDAAPSAKEVLAMQQAKLKAWRAKSQSPRHER